jgi:RNA-directed DNA polymerase
MSKLQSLKTASSLNDVAVLLGFKPAFLSYILYKQAAAEKYKSFQIPKKHGGMRSITAPLAGLKFAQKRLSDLLQECAGEISKAKGRKDWVSHGFKIKRSIVTNASQHRHRRYVFNVDLKDFFSSINFGRVRGYFMKQNELALDTKVATVLAQIACVDNGLPQGSPCSPVISNLIAHILDMYCVKLASKAGCTYSRYADDLTFSTNKKVFPAEIAVRSEMSPHEWAPAKELSGLVKRSGFDINPAKTRMQYRDSRQEVTGLVVNKRINVRHEYRHNVRAMVHQLLKTGSFNTLVPEKDPASGAVTMKEKAGNLNQLHGMLSFIGFVDVKNKERSKNQPQETKRLSSKDLYTGSFSYTGISMLLRRQ